MQQRTWQVIRRGSPCHRQLLSTPKPLKIPYTKNGSTKPLTFHQHTCDTGPGLHRQDEGMLQSRQVLRWEGRMHTLLVLLLEQPAFCF